MKTILLAAIGITIAIMLLRESPPPQPPQPSKAVAPVAPAAPKQAQAQITPKPVSAPKLELKRIPAEPLVVKGVDLGPQPELIPTASVFVAPPAAPAAPVQQPPNSVFGWGPWAAGQSLGNAGGGSFTPSARTEAPPPSVTVASSAPSISGVNGFQPSAVSSAPVIPPPQLGGIKPGHGFGDRNHVHRHKHFPDFAGPRGRDR